MLSIIISNWPAISDGSVWHRQWSNWSESEHLIDQRTQHRKFVSVTVLGVLSLQHCTQLLMYPSLHLKIEVRELRDTEININQGTFIVLWYFCDDVSCLWSVQEKSYSPVEPGCSGLCSPNEKVHSCHVNVSICQELNTNAWGHIF